MKTAAKVSKKIPPLAEKISVDSEENKLIYFTPLEWKYFKLEIEEMKNNGEELNYKKAIHNAKYFAMLEKSEREIKEGKNIVTFSDEEWEDFVNAQDLQ